MAEKQNQNQSNNDFPEKLKTELNNYFSNDRTANRARNILQLLKQHPDRTTSEQQGLFAPYRDNPDEEYEVQPEDLDTYEAFKLISVESSNVSDQHKRQIADEMGWDLDSEELDLKRYNLKEHYYKICETLLKGFKSDYNRPLNMPTVHRLVAFFVGGGR